MTDCWMWDSKNNRCGGYTYTECPPDCKFKCTFSQQLNKENEIYEHIEKDKPFLYNDFVSMVEPGFVYVEANQHNKARALLMQEV